MTSEQLKINAEVLSREIEWFQRLVQVRFELYFDGDSKYTSIEEIEEPVLSPAGSQYAEFVVENKLNFGDRVLLLLALIPHVRPALLNSLFVDKPDRMHALKFSRVPRKSVYHEFGGVPGINFKGFLPTGITYLFLMTGDDAVQRLQYSARMTRDHLFAQLSMVYLEPHYLGEPTLSGKLVMHEPWVEFFTVGRSAQSPTSLKYFDSSAEEKG